MTDSVGAVSDPGPRAPAGWYDEPEVPGVRQYWDGGAWTGERQSWNGETWVWQRTTAAGDRPEPSRRSALVIDFSARNLFIGAAMLIGVGSLAPWATTILGSVSGTAASGGKVTLGCAVIIVLLALNNAPRWMVGVVALIAGAIGVSNFQSVHHAVAGTAGLAQVGWGLYIVIVGAGLGVVALFAEGQTPY